MWARSILSATFVALVFQADPALEAQAAFEKAEARVRAGRFEEARAEFKRIAAKYPGTPAAKEAESRSTPSAFLGWTDVVRSGPSKNRVDVVLMGDGYEIDHMGAFDKLSEDIPPLFARQSTFREYYSYFNFIRAELLSAESGVDGFGREYDTALNGKTLNTFAGHVGIDRPLVMSVMSKIPDTDGQAIVFVKNGVLGTGGGGIATIGGQSVTTIIHEFGHSFGGLSDEYESQQSHGQGANPKNGINVAASDDPQSAPWAHWIEAKHPSVGMVEGAMGRVKGAWRPTSTGCVMSSGEDYCVVCREALVLKIYSVVDPIESVTPGPIAQGAPDALKFEADTLEIVANVMKPATHALEVTWWVLPEARVPASAGVSTKPGKTGVETKRERWRRGALEPITDEPRTVTKTNVSGVHKLVLKRSELAPGRYRVVCRVRDATKFRGDKFPWVLKDELGLLESERGWWVDAAKAP